MVWSTFMETERETPAGAGDWASGFQRGAILCAPDWGLIRAAGPEAEKFLQGQFSNDIRQVNAGQGQLSSYSTAKGRMLANFFIQLWDGAYWLHLSADLEEPIVERLKKYRLGANVELEGMGGIQPRFVLLGPEAGGMAAGLGAEIPAGPGGTWQGEGYAVSRLPWPGVDAWIFLGTEEVLNHLWSRLRRAGALPAPQERLSLAAIRAGMGQVTAATVERIIPQELNLEGLGAINFKKGCYTGQEIVARAHYLGKLKNQTYRLAAEADPAPGAEVFSDALPGQAMGIVVNGAPAETGFECLAVLRAESADAPLHLGKPGGPGLQVLELPYPLPLDSAKGS